MGLAAWLDLEGRDVAAFMVAGLLGFVAGHLVPPGWWAVYTSILVSYHLFLAWLVLSADQGSGVSLPIVSTIATHLAFMALVVALGLARHVTPLFGFFRYGIAALAIFERGWLFGGKAKPPNEQIAEVVPSTSPILAGTADDYREWELHLAQQKPGSRTMGTSLKAEYEQWLLTRAKSRAGDGMQER
jgi:hypothetical protein